jgi:hypothetical protein
MQIHLHTICIQKYVIFINILSFLFIKDYVTYTLSKNTIIINKQTISIKSDS